MSFTMELRRKQLNVQRLTGTPVLRKYDLAQHSFFVTQIFYHLAKTANIAVTAEQMDAVMNHDLLEVLTGDLPYPVKNTHKATKNAWEFIEGEVIDNSKHKDELSRYHDTALAGVLGNDLFMLFKLADMLELWVFCREEQQLGNNTRPIQKVIEKCTEYLHSQIDQWLPEHPVHDAVTNIIQEYGK